jgi:UDP-glucose 4-epimerase
VTGAGGYVGSRLIGALTQAGTRVRPIVRRHVPYLGGDQVVVDLLGDLGAIDAAIAGAESVVHLAGPNEIATASNPEAAVNATIAGSRRVAAAAVRAGVRRLVYVSTVHVYGARIVDGATVDEETPTEPRSEYALARLTSEHLVGAAAAEGVEVVVFRLSNSIGAPADARVDRWSLVATDLCRQAALDGTLTLRSSGAQWRDFIALRDVVTIVAGCSIPGTIQPGTYNLASGDPRTVRHLAEVVQDVTESATGARPALIAPDLPAELPIPYRVATEKLASNGWKANTRLCDAVAETLAFCLENIDSLRSKPDSLRSKPDS